MSLPSHAGPAARAPFWPPWPTGDTPPQNRGIELLPSSQLSHFALRSFHDHMDDAGRALVVVVATQARPRCW
jgi:hypothetical protein